MILFNYITRIKLYKILIAAALIRIIAIYSSYIEWFTVDSHNYILQAESIINGNPISSFPNGYPILISILLLIASKSLLPYLLLSINLIAQLVTLYFINRISIHLNLSDLQRNAVLILFALYPSQNLLTSMLLTESISTFLLTASVYFFLIHRYKLGTLLAVILMYTRTSFLPLVPLIIICKIFQKEYKLAAKISLQFSLLVILVFSFDLLGITSYPTNQNYNLLIAINSPSSNINHDLSAFSSEEKANPKMTYFLFALNEPFLFLKQRLIAFYELWGPYPFEINNKIIKLIFGFRFILFVSFIISLFYLRKDILPRLKDFIIFTSFPVLIITFIHTVYFSSFRFIAPLEPILLILLVIIFSKLKTELSSNLNKS